MTDWQLNTEMQNKLAERFIRAYSLKEESFAEVIMDLASEKTMMNYESCLQAIRGNSQNHIFADLPDAGLEEQLINLMTDSTAYLIGKRCGLPDDEIVLNDGMKTISHFNRIPLIAPLGNAVMGNAKEILIEMELTIKSINTERMATNEREQTESQLHGERRTQVSESANIQRQQSGRTSRQIRPDGNGISEGEPPRSFYSFENGWQSDENDAQGAGRSFGENRTADTADAQNRTSAADGGHNGTHTPPEQPETVGGGNRAEGNRPAAEVTPEQPNTSEKEPSDDGSFSLPVSQYLEKMMLSNLFYPPNFFNRLRYISASADTDERKAERIKAAFLSDGNHTSEIDGTPVSVTATEENLVYHIGNDGKHDFSFKWDTMQELVHGFIENGTFPEMSPVMSDDEVRRHYEYILTSTNLYPSELHHTLRSFLTEQPENADWTEKAEQTKTAFQEYGNREYQGDVLYRSVLRDEGVQMYFGDSYTFLPWNMLANIVNAMIEDGEYRGYYYDTETGFYYLQSRYYS